MAVVLPTFWSIGQLRSWWDPPLDAAVFAVMLAVAVPRGLRRVEDTQLPAAVAALIVASAAAVGCSMLVGIDTWQRALGAGLFALGASTGVWVRRFGDAWRAYGTMAGLPFLAVLVHPLPLERAWSFLGWMLLAANIAVAWALVARLSETPSPHKRVADGAVWTQRPAQFAATGTARRRLASSTKMAVQLAVAVSAAFGVAEMVDRNHLVWPVLTALIVHSGNRGRGDVLWKGIQRTGGALIGTVVATWLAGTYGPGDDVAIVAIFAVLALAFALRDSGYVYWAACITAALAFLYGYFGQGGSSLLSHRLLGVLAGSAVGIAAAWFILPIRSTDVARQRLNALLAQATDVAACPARGGHDPAMVSALTQAVTGLNDLDATARAARHFGIGRARTMQAALQHARSLSMDLITLVERDATTASTRQDFALLARAIGQARRALGTAAPSANRSPADSSHNQRINELITVARTLATLADQLRP